MGGGEENTRVRTGSQDELGQTRQLAMGFRADFQSKSQSNRIQSIFPASVPQA